ncbi:Uncharacterised protein [Enterobacter hormaechei]|nr:Uncharacterised protein [Enterobacter hormaechei]
MPVSLRTCLRPRNFAYHSSAVTFLVTSLLVTSASYWLLVTTVLLEISLETSGRKFSFSC